MPWRVEIRTWVGSRERLDLVSFRPCVHTPSCSCAVTALFLQAHRRQPPKKRMPRYKVGSGIKSRSVERSFSQRKKQPFGERKKTTKMAIKQKCARIHWGDESVDDLSSSPSKFVEDKTWIMNYEHQAVNFTDLYIKAGSKLMALTGVGDSDLKLRTSESGIVRKYRQVVFFFSSSSSSSSSSSIKLFFECWRINL